MKITSRLISVVVILCYNLSWTRAVGIGCNKTVSITSPQFLDPGSNFFLSCNATCATNTTQVLWYNSSGPILFEITSSYDASSGTLMSYLSLNNIGYNDDASYTCCPFNNTFCRSTLIVVSPTVSPPALTGLVGSTSSSFICNVQSSFDATINWYIHDLEGNLRIVLDGGINSGAGSRVKRALVSSGSGFEYGNSGNHFDDSGDGNSGSGLDGSGDDNSGSGHIGSGDVNSGSGFIGSGSGNSGGSGDVNSGSGFIGSGNVNSGSAFIGSGSGNSGDDNSGSGFIGSGSGNSGGSGDDNSGSGFTSSGSGNSGGSGDDNSSSGFIDSGSGNSGGSGDDNSGSGFIGSGSGNSGGSGDNSGSGFIGSGSGNSGGSGDNNSGSGFIGSGGANNLGSGLNGSGDGDSGSGSESSEDENFNGRIYNFSTITFDDAGTYHCSINVEMLGEIQSTNATLTVSPESSVTAAPRNSSSFEGDSVLFTCFASGGPGNMFTWTRLLDNTTVGNTSNITVSVTGADDGGQYMCEVSNLAGRDSVTIHLNVGPAVVTHPTSVNVSLSDSTTLNCTASGFPVPMISWTHNGEEMTEYQLGVNRSTITNVIGERAVTSTLTIYMTTANDAGQYLCNANSPSYPTVSSFIANVLVQSIPGQIRSISIVAVTETSVLLEWVEPNDNGSPILGYRVDYSVAIPVRDVIVSVVSTGNRLSVTELHPGTIYNFSVVAFNDIGTSAPSTIMVTTNESAPTSSPQNVTATALSSTEILVNWTDIPDTDQNGVIAMYEVMYEPLMTFGGVLVTSTVITTSLSITLTELEEYVEYNISVRAYTSDGAGPYSVGTVVRTLEDVPSSPPSEVMASVRVRPLNDAQVTWSAVDSIDQNGIITQYEVRIIRDVDDTSRIESTDGQTFSLDIAELQQAMLYNISVRAHTSVGPGPFSDNLVIITFALCVAEFHSGFLWSETIENNAISLQCNNAGSRFSSGPVVTRHCLEGGNWGEVDLTNCTTINEEPFLIVYFNLSGEGVGSGEITRTPNPEDTYSEESLLLEMKILLNSTAVEYTDVSTVGLFATAIVTVSFEIILNPLTVPNVEDLVRTIRSQSSLGLYHYDDYGIVGIVPSETCQCGLVVNPQQGILVQLCFGVSVSPCDCTFGQECNCRTPFVGDGDLCTVDSDGDGYPDVALNSTSCDSGSTIEYCNQDVCPMVHDVTQVPTLCQVTPEFDGCPFGFDTVWSIEWPNTVRSSTSTQQCPGALGAVVGQSTRYCNAEGEWEEPSVLDCQEMEFVEIAAMSSNLLSGTLDSEAVAEEAVEITQTLAVITETDTTPLLPSSLNTTNQVLTTVISALEQVGGNNTAAVTVASELVVDVFSNILERNNSNTWMSLQESQSAGSQVLLSNVERFGVLVAQSQAGNDSTVPVRISRPNIAVSATLYDASTTMDARDLTFPQEEDLANYSSSIVPAEISIPPGLLQERLSQQNGSALPVTFTLLQNLEAFLPSTARGLDGNVSSASVILSSQIGVVGSTSESATLQDSPILLNFSAPTLEEAPNTRIEMQASGRKPKEREGVEFQYHCVFWNFSNPIGNGGWISDGVVTRGNSTNEVGQNTSTVNCASSHLTSFAVLFTAFDSNETRVDKFALEVVSYVGGGISIVSLLIAVIFYLFQWKALSTSVHNFVHLNLCISMLLSYTVFVAGVSSAVGNNIGCAFVAALLHYLFLSTFCWMLCEGVMLYLMLIVVFSQLAKKWWFFLLLGYITPLPIVGITVGVRWQYYENLDVCWLPRQEGTIFGFIAPVIAILLINVVFLFLGLRVILKNAKSKNQRASTRGAKVGTRKTLARSILLASVVLLPLLGLTWLFGLLIIYDISPVFRWLFTVLNSLQGLAILFFHVIRNDKVWSKIGPCLTSHCKCFKKKDRQPRKFRLLSGSSWSKKGSISEGTSTLKSTLPRDSTLKRDSSLSYSNPVHLESHSEMQKEDLSLANIPEESTEEIVAPLSSFSFQFKRSTVNVIPNYSESTV